MREGTNAETPARFDSGARAGPARFDPGARARLAALALVIGVVAVAWSGRVAGPFVFDDLPSVAQSANVRAPEDALDALQAPPGSNANGRPLVALSLAANHALGGLDPVGYHVLNVALHLACALAVFALARRRIGDGWAASLAALWAVHPLVTDAVNPVVGRTEVLVALFGVLALLAADEGFARAARGGRAGGAFALAALCGALAAASKEVAVAIPLLVLGWQRAFWAPSLGAALARHGAALAALAAATWLPLALLVASSDRGESVGFELEGVTPLDYLRTQAGVVLGYLRLAVWPAGLSADHGDWPIARDAAAWIAPAALLLGLMMASAIALFRGRSAATRAAGWLGVAAFAWLAPSSSVVPLAGDVFAEHRMYLPSAAVVALAVLGLRRIAARGRSARRAAVGATALLLLAACVATRARNEVWQDAISLWSDVVSERPANARAWNSLGVALAAAGRDHEAEDAYRRCLAVRADHAKACYNLANLLHRSGREAEAVALFERAAKLDADSFEAALNRGESRIAAGRVRDGLADLERAFALAPERSATRARLAWHLAVAPEDELRDAARALALCDRDPSAGTRGGRPPAESGPRLLDARVAALASLGRFEEAVETATRALEAARARDQRALAAELEARLATYRTGRPWRASRP